MTRFPESSEECPKGRDVRAALFDERVPGAPSIGLRSQKFSFAGSKAIARPLLLIAYRASSDLAGKGAYFVLTVVAARRLSEAGFALFSLASVLGWLLALASDGGIQLHLARSIARHPSAAGAILRRWLRVRLWTSTGALVAGALAVLLVDRGNAAPVFLLVLVYAINGVTELLHYFYRAIERSDVESSLTLWQRGGLLVCGLAALALRPDVTWLAAAMLLPAASTCGFTIWFALGLSATTARPGGATLEPTGFVLSDFRREALPIGIGVLLSALYFRVDLFLVQLWQGAEAVARYNAAFRLVEALRLFPAAVLAVVLPSIFRAQTPSLLVRLSVALTACALAASTLLWATAGWAIPFLYGARYAAAVPAFRILVWSFPLLALNYALTHQLIGWDGQRRYAWICGAVLAVNLALNAVLIPAASIAGAAWATLVTELALTAGCALVLPAAYGRWRTRTLAPADLAIEARG